MLPLPLKNSFFLFLTFYYNKKGVYDARSTFAAEKLEEVHAIKISNEALRKDMIKAGIWRGRKRKIKHRELRERKAIFDLMIQLDGSDHDWFEGRAPKCTLLVFIDWWDPWKKSFKKQNS